MANVFHAGDGNLHPLVCYDGAVEGEAERAEELSGRILDACLDAGGSITGEHGVGVDKKQHMPKMFGEADLDAFQRLRCAFDPAGLANPGKVMPTPRLCGEVPGPYRAASAGGGRAWRSGSDGRPTRRRRRRPRCRGARAPVRPARRRHEAGWGAPTRGRGRRSTRAGSTASSSTTRATSPPCSRRACRSRRRRRAFAAQGQLLALDPPPARATRRRSAASSPPPTPARCGTATAACATSSSASPSCSSDGTVAKSGGKVIKNVAGYDLASCSRARSGRSG